jgi:hypothetical protein
LVCLVCLFVCLCIHCLLFPDSHSQVQPQSCRPREQAGRGTIDDCLGHYALTLVDSLDTFIVRRMVGRLIFSYLLHVLFIIHTLELRLIELSCSLLFLFPY